MSAVAETADVVDDELLIEEPCVASARISFRFFFFHIEGRGRPCDNPAAFNLLMRCGEHGQERIPICRWHYWQLQTRRVRAVCSICRAPADTRAL